MTPKIKRPQPKISLSWSILFIILLFLAAVLIFATLLISPSSPQYSAEVIPLTQDPTHIPQPTRQTPSPTPSIEDHLIIANQAYFAKDYVKAIHLYKDVIAMDVSNAEAYHHLGSAYLAIEQYRAAYNFYSIALDLEPDSSAYYRDKKVAYYFSQSYNPFLVENIYVNDFEYQELFFHGYMAYLDKDYKGAQTHFEQMTQIMPHDPLAYYSLGFMQRLLEDYHHSLQSFTRAIELDPANGDLYWNRGLVYHYLHDYYAALKDFDKAIEIESYDDSNTVEKVTSSGANFYIQQGWSGAYTFAVIQLATKPYDPVAYNDYGVIEFHRGDWDRSLLYFNQAIELDPKYDRAYINRGYVHVMMGNVEAGIKDINYAIYLDDTNTLAFQYRAFAYFQAKDYHAAISDYVHAIVRGDYDADAYRGLGDVYYDLSQFEDALGHYETYLQMAGDYADDDIIKRVQALRNDLKY